MKIFIVLAVLVAVAYAQHNGHCAMDSDCSGFTCHGHTEPFCDRTNNDMCGCRAVKRQVAAQCTDDGQCAGLICHPHTNTATCVIPPHHHAGTCQCP